MTEIRELIFPEDRTRYDELVYRRGRGGDIYGDPLDRHRVSSVMEKFTLCKLVTNDNVGGVERKEL